MKLASIVLPGLLVLAGCTTQPEAPKPPKIGMANPASVLRTKGWFSDCGADSARC